MSESQPGASGSWTELGHCDPSRLERHSEMANLGAPALLAQSVEHLHGKEGVDGSSPSEGFRKRQQMAFFVAGRDYAGVLTDPQPVAKICPQRPKLTMLSA